VTEQCDARTITDSNYAGWRRLLAATSLLSARLDGCRLEGEHFRSYPAGSSTLDRVEGDRWLAVGDAACTLDPICSQGIHKALAEAADASRTIAGAYTGEQSAARSYGDRVTARFQDYLVNRAQLYGLERRWSTRPFWQHRATA
jgi:flavin-dependent dehydrogenase